MREVKIDGIYRYYKGGYYLVDDISRFSNSDKEYVVFREIRNTNIKALSPYGQYEAESYEYFTREVDREKYPYIRQKYRYELVEDLKVEDLLKY